MTDNEYIHFFDLQGITAIEKCELKLIRYLCIFETTLPDIEVYSCSWLITQMAHVNVSIIFFSLKIEFIEIYV